MRDNVTSPVQAGFAILTMSMLVSVLLAGLGIIAGSISPVLSQPRRVETTLSDFFQPGTQPGMLRDEIQSSTLCRGCHGGSDVRPHTRWSASMMAQAARDPLFHAAMAVAEKDMAFVGDICLRCHAPIAWLEGRSTPTDGSALQGKDFDGVTCHFCHRFVDPTMSSGNPSEDLGILDELALIPQLPHTGQYVVDPQDSRRGPFDDLLPSPHPHGALSTPFFQASLLCAPCHDVSNPAYTRQADGSYLLNDVNTPHPTHDKNDQFPIERTFSEWTQSDFAKGPIDLAGRFGGNKNAVSTCQDCHMPDATGAACPGGRERVDQPLHNFNGANTWVLDAILNLDETLELYDTPSNLSQDVVDAAQARNIEMLRQAADLELTREDDNLRVRIVNQAGHKLPTGYPEGRRMWLNVQFYDDTLEPSNRLIAEHGAYDANTATLSTEDTKVYEAQLGIDENTASRTGLPPGKSFHFALNNRVITDNRIPPRGFTNAGFAAIQAAPVGTTYEDGQHWDDTEYPIPRNTTRAVVTLFYQTSSREYIEFLRDANTTNNAGQILFTQWEVTGRSTPVAMNAACVPFVQNHDGDVNQDGILTPRDALLAFKHFLGLADPPLDACQQDRANVVNPEMSGVTPEDALCILRHTLNIQSC